jgi:hypothetical protein
MMTQVANTLMSEGVYEENESQVLIVLSNSNTGTGNVEILRYGIIIDMELLPTFCGCSAEFNTFINSLDVSVCIVITHIAIILTECSELELVSVACLSSNLVYSTEAAEWDTFDFFRDASISESTSLDSNVAAHDKFDVDSVVLFTVDSCNVVCDTCSDLVSLQQHECSVEPHFLQPSYVDDAIEEYCSVLETLTTVHMPTVTLTNEEECNLNDDQSVLFNESLPLFCSSWCYVDNEASLTYQSHVQSTLVSPCSVHVAWNLRFFRVLPLKHFMRSCVVRTFLVDKHARHSMTFRYIATN